MEANLFLVLSLRIKWFWRIEGRGLEFGLFLGVHNDQSHPA